MSDRRPRMISVSLGGTGTFPAASEAVAHAVAEPKHLTVLIVDTDWDQQAGAFEDALRWYCDTCGEGEW